MATTTASGGEGRSASEGKQGTPWADSRPGFTPQTSPAYSSRLRLSSVSPAYDPSRSVAPTTAIVRGWSRRERSTGLVERPFHPAPLQRAGDDQPLDLAGALPDAVHAQLAVEPLGHVGAHVAAPAEYLQAAVRAAAGRLAHEQLRHRGLGVDDLGIGAGVDQARHLERQQAPGGSVRGGVRQRERHALVVHDSPPPLLTRERPGRGVLDQPPHRADAARGDPEALLGEPGALEVVAAAGPADHGVVRHLDAGEADRRVAVR